MDAKLYAKFLLYGDSDEENEEEENEYEEEEEEEPIQQAPRLHDDFEQLIF